MIVAQSGVTETRVQRSAPPAHEALRIRPYAEMASAVNAFLSTDTATVDPRLGSPRGASSTSSGAPPSLVLEQTGVTPRRPAPALATGLGIGVHADDSSGEGDDGTGSSGCRCRLNHKTKQWVALDAHALEGEPPGLEVP